MIANTSRSGLSTISTMNLHSNGSKTPTRLHNSARNSCASASAPQWRHAQLFVLKPKTKIENNVVICHVRGRPLSIYTYIHHHQYTLISPNRTRRHPVGTSIDKNFSAERSNALASSSSVVTRGRRIRSLLPSQSYSVATALSSIVASRAPMIRFAAKRNPCSVTSSSAFVQPGTRL